MALQEILLDEFKNYQQEPIEIIDVGIPNPNAGADFSNAKIKLDNLIWAGDVEIHLRSSDWNRHQHHKNEAYNNVILHVVAECDCKIYDSNNREIPQIEIVISKEFLKIFPKRNTFILCEKSIINIDSFTKKNLARNPFIRTLYSKNRRYKITFSTKWERLGRYFLCFPIA